MMQPQNKNLSQRSLIDNSKYAIDNSSRFFFYEIVKRFFDIVVSLFVLIMLSPLFLFLTLLIRRDGGSALYPHTRIGRYGVPFTMYKFRSMCMNADRLKDNLNDFNELDGPVFKIKEDPRVTRLGRFLRKYSLDELPQFLNVLMGDMSIVGPRPQLEREVIHYDEYQKQRLLAKQGITCYWQCQGRNDLSFEQWMDLDVKYIKERSLFVDFCIILATIPAVLCGRGAS